MGTRLEDIKKRKDDISRVIAAHKRMAAARQTLAAATDPVRQTQAQNDFKNAKLQFENTEKDVLTLLQSFEVQKSDHAIV